MAKGKPQKITNIKKYRKPLNLNIGVIIFATIFIYIVVMISMYFKQNYIRPYEVKEGSLSTNNVYTGIALREEEIITSQEAGYVNYYFREGERVAVGNLVYTVDETGQLNDYLNSEELGENALSDSDLMHLKDEIVDFRHGFSANRFLTTYDFKNTVKGTVLKLANNSLMSSIQDINSNAELSDLVQFCYANSTGILEYWVDGYESLTPATVTEDCFNRKDYKKTNLNNNNLIAQQDVVYKICTDENWSLVLPIDATFGQELVEKEYVKVRFLKNQDEAWGKTSLLHNGDNVYLQLDFTNSMVTFAGDRYLEVELIINESMGLKIPNSSVAEMEFYLVSKEYITQSGSSKSSYGVLREISLEDGTLSTEFVKTTIYSEKDGEYYLDTSILRTGDHIIMPESAETYTISRRATLIGVYNMNRGYAEFKQIEILYSNEEYSIVKSNTNYGLNVYDLIVLDASSVNENQFIYE